MRVFSRLHRHIDSLDSMGELIFGLLMVLTFTIGARLVAADEPTDGKELLVAAIGCNIAWGIIDGFLYILGRLYERRRILTLINSLATSGNSAALAMLQDELAGNLSDLGDPRSRDSYYVSIITGAQQKPAERARLTFEDFRGAALVFCLVSVTAVPAVLPFMAIDDSYLALRISNAILISLLFLVGFRWGHHVGSKPWFAGLSIMLVGIALVLIAIPLGG